MAHAPTFDSVLTPVPSWPPCAGKKDGVSLSEKWHTNARSCQRKLQALWQFPSRIRSISASGAVICITEGETKTTPKGRKRGLPDWSRSIPKSTHLSASARAEEIPLPYCQRTISSWNNGSAFESPRAWRARGKVSSGILHKSKQGAGAGASNVQALDLCYCQGMANTRLGFIYPCLLPSGFSSLPQLPLLQRNQRRVGNKPERRARRLLQDAPSMPLENPKDGVVSLEPL